MPRLAECHDAPLESSRSTLHLLGPHIRGRPGRPVGSQAHLDIGIQQWTTNSSESNISSSLGRGRPATGPTSEEGGPGNARCLRRPTQPTTSQKARSKRAGSAPIRPSNAPSSRETSRPQERAPWNAANHDANASTACAPCTVACGHMKSINFALANVSQCSKCTVASAIGTGRGASLWPLCCIAAAKASTQLNNHFDREGGASVLAHSKWRGRPLCKPRSLVFHHARQMFMFASRCESGRI